MSGSIRQDLTVHRIFRGFMVRLDSVSVLSRPSRADLEVSLVFSANSKIEWNPFIYRRSKADGSAEFFAGVLLQLVSDARLSRTLIGFAGRVVSPNVRRPKRTKFERPANGTSHF